MTGEACANQAFVFGSSLGMQCHIEMTSDMVRKWCGDWDAEGVENSRSVEGPSRIVEGIATHLQPMRAVSDRLYARWLEGARHS